MPKHIRSLNAGSLTRRGNKWVAPVRGPALVAVVSDFCGHCTTLKKTLSTMKTPVKAYLVSSDNQDADTQNFMRSMNITGVPELFRVSDDGTLDTYHGARDETSLVQHFGGNPGHGHSWERCVLPFVILVVIVLMLFKRK